MAIPSPQTSPLKSVTDRQTDGGAHSPSPTILGMVTEVMSAITFWIRSIVSQLQTLENFRGMHPPVKKPP